MMKRLYIDGLAISLFNKGVGRYSYELIQRVSSRLDEQWKIDVFVYTYDVPSELKDNRRINLIRITKMNDLFHNLIWLPLHLRKQHYDILLKPMESSGINYNVPTITICHDVQELIDEAAGIRQMPHRMFINYIKRVFKSLNLQKSVVVICNSIFTQDAAAAWYKFDKSKAVIGYCGVDERFFVKSKEFMTGKKKKRLECTDFILTFATGDARENHDFLPGILFNIREKGCNSKLIIAGIREGSEYVKKMDAELKKYNLQPGLDYQFIGFLGEERIDELVELYTTADFYLELSGHEGFGMQLAEAMACSTTCISSGAGALAEVGAGFDVQLLSFNVNEISSTIVDSYKNKLHIRDNSEQVKYVSTHFTWDTVADLVVENIELFSLDEKK